MSIIFILLSFFSIFLVIAEYLTHNNLILNIFRIDYLDLFVLSTLLLIVNFLIKFKFNIKNYWKEIVLFLPIFLTISAIIIFLKRHDLFLYLESEDSIIEYLQVLLLGSNAVLSAILSKLFWKQNKLLSIIFIAISMGFFLVVGEEVSWGQRIFDIKTPEKYAGLNIQGEITLHNYGPVFEFVYKAYAAIGFIGAFAWTIKDFVAKKLSKIFKQVINVLVPNWQYMFYFLVAFLYNLEVHILNPRTGANLGNALWEEPMELLLFFGITIFLFELLIRKRAEFSHDKKNV